MKKSTKTLLIISLSVFALGIILLLTAIIIQKATNKDTDIENKESFYCTLSELSESSQNSDFALGLSDTYYKKISVKLYCGNVEIKSTDKSSYIEFENINKNNISYSVERDTVTVNEINEVNSGILKINNDGIGFAGFNSIFTGKNKAFSEQIVRIYLNPEDNIEDTNIKVFKGKISVNGIKTSELTLNNEFGDVSIKNSDIANKINLTSVISNIEFQNTVYSSAIINSRIGSIDISLPETENDINTVISKWAGNLYISSYSPISDFKLGVSTIIGNCFQNGENLGKNINTSVNSTSRIIVTTYISDIRIDDVK